MKGYEMLAEMYLSSRILAGKQVTEDHRRRAYEQFRMLFAHELAAVSAPAVDEFIGSDPDFTGGKSTEEHIAAQRSDAGAERVPHTFDPAGHLKKLEGRSPVEKGMPHHGQVNQAVGARRRAEVEKARAEGLLDAATDVVRDWNAEQIAFYVGRVEQAIKSDLELNYDENGNRLRGPYPMDANPYVLQDLLAQASRTSAGAEPHPTLADVNAELSGLVRHTENELVYATNLLARCRSLVGPSYSSSPLLEDIDRFMKWGAPDKAGS